MSQTDFASAHWRKSSYSGQEGGTCVELADFGAVVGIRDSKSPDGPILEFSPAEPAALLRTVRTG